METLGRTTVSEGELRALYSVVGWLHPLEGINISAEWSEELGVYDVTPEQSLEARRRARGTQQTEKWEDSKEVGTGKAAAHSRRNCQ